MSEQSTSGIPDAPQASRRALLMGFAAAATPMAPGLASALSESALAVADPIFDLIEKHKAARDAARTFSACWSDMSPRDPEYDVVGEQFDDAYEGERKALIALLTRQPTTIAGVVAVLEHVGQTDWVFGDSEDTVLTDSSERDIEEAKVFPKHLAAALRKIIARGQA
jgi:hypothetical protein